MKKFLLLILLGLAGCGTVQCPQPKIIVQDHYVVSPIPAKDLVIPPQVQKINTKTASQKTVSNWLAAHIGRETEMEIKLKNISQIQADQAAAAAKLNAQQPTQGK